MKRFPPEPGTEVAGRFAASPEAALALLAGTGGPGGAVLLDLDETLYLRSSTEDFIDSARPRLAAFALLRLVERLGPWRWTGGPVTRDNWRLGAVRLAFPWTGWLWRRRLPALAAAFANVPLRAAALPREVVIVTSGFLPVVAPLVAALGLGRAEIVAVRVFVPGDRRAGKLALALRQLGAERLRDAVLITDSADDAALLDRVGRGALTLWPGARFRPAFADLYVPGRYVATVKRPGTGYVRRAILQDDLPMWLACSMPLAAQPALHLGGIALLLLSFWAVYEQGYVDNDLVAQRLEADPQLSAAFAGSELARNRPEPWIWAALSGLAGVALLTPAGGSPLWGCGIWAALLAAVALGFRWFNRLDKATRLWPFAALQLARGGAFAVLVPVAPVTAAAVGAYVIEKWLPYFVYRTGLVPGAGAAKPAAGSAPSVAAWALPLATIRLLFFAVLLACTAPAVGLPALAGWPTAAIAGLFAFRARRELRGIVGRAARIDRGRG